MQSHIWSGLLALAMAAVVLGCRTSAPAESAAGGERQALQQRASQLRDEAMRGGTPTPVRQAEFRQLADDVRAWQQGTGHDDLRVTQESVATARRADGGGGAGCDDCPGYRLDGDNICLLEQEGDCPVDEGDDLTIGRVCVYTCIWIGSRAEPASLNKPDKPRP